MERAEEANRAKKRGEPNKQEPTSRDSLWPPNHLPQQDLYNTFPFPPSPKSCSLSLQELDDAVDITAAGTLKAVRHAVRMHIVSVCTF